MNGKIMESGTTTALLFIWIMERDVEIYVSFCMSECECEMKWNVNGEVNYIR